MNKKTFTSALILFVMTNFLYSQKLSVHPFLRKSDAKCCEIGQHQINPQENKFQFPTYEYQSLSSEGLTIDTIQYSGDSENTYDLVILAEGYTSAEIPKFKADAKKVKEILKTNDVYSKLLPKMNIFSIGTISQESGISLRKNSNNLPTDPIQTEKIKNTYFGVYFANSFRAYILDDSSTYKARNLASEFLPFSDNVLILANDEDYSSGRASFEGVALATRFKSKDSLWSNYLVNHELAHSIGNLTDEYFEGKGINFNKDITNDPTKIKWKAMLKLPGVKIDSVVTGTYIPNLECMMAFGAGTYTCPVCTKRLNEVIEEPRKLRNPHRVLLEKFDKDKKTYKVKWDPVPSASGYEVVMWALWRNEYYVKNTSTTDVTFELTDADVLAIPGWRITVQIRAYDDKSSSEYKYHRTSIWTHTTLSVPIVRESKKISETSYKLYIESKEKTVKANWIRLYNEEGIHSDIITYKDSITLNNLKKGKKYFYQIAAAIPEESADFFASPFSPIKPLFDICSNNQPSPISGQQFEYCLNSSTQPLAIKADEGNTLLWYQTDTSTTSSTTPPVISSTKSGISNYYVSQTNSQGCQSLKTKISVNINNPPSNPLVQDLQQCQNSNAKEFNVTPEVGAQLLWYTSLSAPQGNTQAPSISTATAGNFQFFVSQKNQLGCESQKSTINVLINESPKAPITENKEFCQNFDKKVNLTAKFITGNIPFWYTNNSSYLFSGDSLIFSLSNHGSFKFFVTQKDQKGCESEKAELSVTVQKPPAPPVPQKLELCQYSQPKSITVKVDSSNELRWYTFFEEKNGSTVQPTYSTQQQIPFNFFVSQVTKIGCESQKAIAIVEIKYTPVAPFVHHQKELCQNEGDVRPLRVDHNPTSKILWYTDTIKAGSLQIPTISVDQPGKYRYYVSETPNSGCESAKTEININVKPAPPIPTLSIVNNIEIQSSAKTNFWYWNNSLQANETAQTIKPKFSGNYSAEAVNDDKCKSKRSETLNFMITSLREELLSKFTIKPNPFEDYITLDFSINDRKVTQVDLVTLTGEIVKSYYEVESGSKLNINNLPTGVYFLQIHLNKNGLMVSKKLVKI